MADITKLNEQITAWNKNLEFLQSGGFGPISTFDEAETARTMLQYWTAQARAGYPGARENVKYFESRVRCNPIGDLHELIKTIEAEMENDR